MRNMVSVRYSRITGAVSLDNTSIDPEIILLNENDIPERYSQVCQFSLVGYDECEVSISNYTCPNSYSIEFITPSRDDSNATTRCGFIVKQPDLKSFAVAKIKENLVVFEVC